MAEPFDYLLERAFAERRAALASRDPQSRTSHTQLAEAYEHQLRAINPEEADRFLMLQAL